MEVLNAVVARKRPPNIEKPDGGYFRWPSTEIHMSGRGRTTIEPDHDRGVLRAVGYRVGVNGLGWAERRALLTHVYQQELTLNLTAEYLAEWGQPRTSQRLQKLANTIASLTRNMKRRQLTRSPAIDQWEDDLEFLKQTYYVGRYDFPWPAS